MGWVEGRGFPIFIEGEHEVEIPGGRVGGEFSIGREPDEEKGVEEELVEGGTARFEKGVGYARSPSAFVAREGLNVVNDFREGGRSQVWLGLSQRGLLWGGEVIRGHSTCGLLRR